MSEKVEPTQEKLNDLPFDATNLEVYQTPDFPNRFQFADWNGRELRKWHNQQWSDYQAKWELTPEDWD